MPRTAPPNACLPPPSGPQPSVMSCPPLQTIPAPAAAPVPVFRGGLSWLQNDVYYTVHSQIEIGSTTFDFFGYLTFHDAVSPTLPVPPTPRRGHLPFPSLSLSFSAESTLGSRCPLYVQADFLLLLLCRSMQHFLHILWPQLLFAQLSHHLATH